jgi:hypothetical protein
MPQTNHGKAISCRRQIMTKSIHLFQYKQQNAESQRTIGIYSVLNNFQFSRGAFLAHFLMV